MGSDWRKVPQLWVLRDDLAEEREAPKHIEGGPGETLCGRSTIGGVALAGVVGKVRVCKRCVMKAFG